MFLLLSKLIPPFLFSPGLQVSLLLVAMLSFRKKPKISFALMVFAAVSLYVLSTGAAMNVLVGALEQVYPELETARVPSADAIIVLGDFESAPTAKRATIGITEGTDRLYKGLLLYRAHKAPLLVFSGGTVTLFGATRRSQASYARDLAIEFGAPPEGILVEGDSQNTHENALRSKEMLASRGVHRVILVTAGFHMPRAAAVFKKAGFDVVPFSADYQTGWQDPQFPFAYLPDASSLKNNQAALHEYLGLIVYKLRGWI